MLLPQLDSFHQGLSCEGSIITSAGREFGWEGTDKMLLTSGKLFEDARVRTGLANLHLGNVSDRLEPLLEFAREKMNLDQEGAAAAHDTFLELLCSRSKMLEDRVRSPEIAEVAIERPIFVTGLPRSGTTFLHSIMAADPNNQAPKWWEVLAPSPPPALIADESADRARINQDIARFISLNPDFLKSHPYFDEGGDTLMECEAFGTTDFRRIVRTIYSRVPGIFPMEFSDTTTVDAFRYHRMVLQALQWKRPQKRWALKGTEHHTCLASLKEVYPDAVVVWLHRDPQKVFPSLMALLSRVAAGTSRKAVNLPEFGRYILSNYREMLSRAMESPMMDHPDVFHLRYADFISNPVAGVNSVYNRYGIPFGFEQENAINLWIADPANKGDRHGKFIYTLEEFKIDRDELEGFAADYRARFQIPFE